MLEYNLLIINVANDHFNPLITIEAKKKLKIDMLQNIDILKVSAEDEVKDTKLDDLEKPSELLNSHRPVELKNTEMISGLPGKLIYKTISI